MNAKRTWMLAAVAAIGVVSMVRPFAIADAPKESAGTPEFKLPPGWSVEEMQRCMIASMPGDNHKRLTESVGTWKGKSTMWMAPGAEPMVSDCTATVASILEGKFTKWEMTGEMAGMGKYLCLGTHGFDNVSKQFVGTWIDNHNTGIMTGVGELSSDGSAITWTYTANCPRTGKPVVLREVETTVGNSKTFDTFALDPKTGKEFQLMKIELIRS